MQDITKAFPPTGSRSGLPVLLLLLGALSLPGCNTLEGAGEDLESAGEAVEDGTDEAVEEVRELDRD